MGTPREVLALHLPVSRRERTRARWWPSACAACVLALAFLAITMFVFSSAGDVTAAAAAFDRTIEDFLQSFRNPALTGRVIEMSALGSAPVLSMLALLACASIVRARDWLGFLHLGVALAGASVMSRLLQHMFERERPESLLSFLVVTKGSFPSAHVLGASACYVTFAFFYARLALRTNGLAGSYAVALLLTLLIGATRIYLGAHHATDVLAGICAGSAWALMVIAAFSFWEAKRSVRG